MATLITDKIYNGTEVKFLLEILVSGFSMDDDDFEVVLKRGEQKELLLTKGDLLCDDKNWYVAFDTAYFGPGVISCIVKAFVPDEDFEDGLRTEVIKFDLIQNLRV